MVTYESYSTPCLHNSNTFWVFLNVDWSWAKKANCFNRGPTISTFLIYFFILLLEVILLSGWNYFPQSDMTIVCKQGRLTYWLSSFIKNASMILSPIGLMASSGMDIKSLRLISKKNKDLWDHNLCQKKGLYRMDIIGEIMNRSSPIKDANQQIVMKRNKLGNNLNNNPKP